MGNKLAEAVGPFHDTARAIKALGVTEQAVENMRDAGELLAAETSDGMWVYPVYQFTGGQVNPALRPAIHAFRHHPGWSAALWFVTRNEDLDGVTPLDWIKTGHDPAQVTRLAGHTAWAWA